MTFAFNSKTSLAVERCINDLRLCVRLGPGQTFKPEGHESMTGDAFVYWVLAKLLNDELKS